MSAGSCFKNFEVEGLSLPEEGHRSRKTASVCGALLTRKIFEVSKI
jgi:hypothetical protein